MDPNAAAAQLLQNQKFVELFQRALGGDLDKDAGTADAKDLFASMPKEGDPRREEWLRRLQNRLQEETSKEAKKELEQVHSDEQGQWMFVLPEPGFCIKTNIAGGSKVFINVCQHARIAEPVPMAPEESAGDSGRGGEQGEERFRIPISCGQARPDKDKSGKPCKVYDVVVNPSTIQRCGSDNEFRRFVAALCLQWIKQKSEPTLNADEFRNLNFKCKGKLEPQRIRLSQKPKKANALGDEIQLPSTTNAATAPLQLNGAQGTGKLIQEVELKTREKKENAESDASADVSVEGSAAARAARTSAPSLKAGVQAVTPEGVYDWTRHIKPAANPYFKESIPAAFSVSLFLPAVQTIAEVDVRVQARRVECYYVDELLADDDDTAEKHTQAAFLESTARSPPSPFLSTTLPYPVSEDVLEAKYVRKTHTLKLKIAVQLPDETREPATKPERDVTEVEAEEQRRVREARTREWAAATAQKEKQQKEEEAIMAERRSYVANLSALQAGDIPPVVREEVDQMPKDQLPALLLRLESRVRKGDSVDVLLQKLPEAMLDALVNYVREKLSLAPRPASNKESATEESLKAPRTPTTEEVAAPPPLASLNASKQSEALFGVAFENRYVFALD